MSSVDTNKTWKTGDVIDAVSLNDIEGGIDDNAGSIAYETNRATASELNLSAKIDTLREQVVNIKLNGGEIKANYTLTKTLTHVIADASNPDTVAYNGTVNLLFTTETGYLWPDTVQVNNIDVADTEVYCGNCTAQFLEATGKLILKNATGDISYSITAEAEVYI